MLLAQLGEALFPYLEPQFLNSRGQTGDGAAGRASLARLWDGHLAHLLTVTGSAGLQGLQTVGVSSRPRARRQFLSFFFGRTTWLVGFLVP